MGHSSSSKRFKGEKVKRGRGKKVKRGRGGSLMGGSMEGQKTGESRRKVTCFEDLFVWQTAVEFARDIYILTEKQGLKTDFGLRNQIRDAVVSISNNIAEGFERRSRKEYLNFLNIAKASAGEVRSLLHVAFAVGYINESERDVLVERARFLGGSLSNHMAAIVRSARSAATSTFNLFPSSPQKRKAFFRIAFRSVPLVVIVNFYLSF